MLCPIKFNTPYVKGYLNECEQVKCAWWNERFGMCCKAVDAYLKGQEDYRNERKINMMDRR
jgi:hypothetical protein